MTLQHKTAHLTDSQQQVIRDAAWLNGFEVTTGTFLGKPCLALTNDAFDGFEAWSNVLIGIAVRDFELAELLVDGVRLVRLARADTVVHLTNLAPFEKGAQR